MKKSILLIIGLVVFSAGYTQNITVKQKNKDLGILEVFEVKKDTPNVKNGNYAKYISNYVDKKLMIEKGQFSDGKKVGTWEFYDRDGKINLKYCFENDSILIYNDVTVNGLKENRPLIYLGSIAEIQQITIMALNIPSNLIGSGVVGKVIVRINVDENGSVSYEIKQSPSEVLNDLAIKTVKMIPLSWLPPLKNGKSVSGEKDIPIMFVL